MGSHDERIRKHLDLERRALLLEAERARILDHHGTRGAEAEHSILRWLRARFAPTYTVSSGEIIDSYDTDADLKSRQQDGIIHRNDADANRFVLPSGVRLVPIESVAAVVEVKLTLTIPELQRADEAATQTVRLRYRPGPAGRVPEEDARTARDGTFSSLMQRDFAHGLAVGGPKFANNRIMFAVLGFFGTVRPEAIAEFLRTAKTISMACCLESGCSVRLRDRSFVSDATGALPHFANWIQAAIKRHDALHGYLRPEFTAYGLPEALPYFDEHGYDWRAAGHEATAEEAIVLDRLIAEREPAR